MNLPSRYRPVQNTSVSGGFGTVTRVHDTFLDREVALKTMSSSVNASQLISEIQLLSKARSRHVVEIYDVIFDNVGNPTGVVIELLSGRKYDDFHLTGASDIGGFIKTLYQIATALAHLHKLGIVHRDLKIPNFLDTSSGVLKLFDFGISSIGAYSTSNNRGTHVYAAPELYVQGALITKEMDIYAFGVCAWFLLTSSLPNSLTERPPQKNAPPPSIATIAGPDLPPQIANLLDTCLEKEPRKRPLASIVSSELRKYLVRNKHRGTFVRENAAIYELSKDYTNVNIEVKGFGELRVVYDGIAFKIAGFSGRVYINNHNAVVGMELPQSCVVTLQNDNNRSSYISFSSSHPEVVI